MIPKNDLLPGSLVYNRAFEVIIWNEHLSFDDKEFSPIQVDIRWIRNLGFGTMDDVYFIHHPFNGKDEFVIKYCADQSICILLAPEQEGEIYPRYYKETDVTCKFIHQLQMLYHLNIGELLEVPSGYKDELKL